MGRRHRYLNEDDEDEEDDVYMYLVDMTPDERAKF